MTDKQVLNELWINCFENQIDGYPFGHPSRNKNFNPIVVIFKNPDGTLNREQIISGPAYTFTDEQKKLLLDTSETKN
jgi:hypothetical protein